MYVTYVLQSAKGMFYNGYTTDLDIRLTWHNQGESRFTRNKGPWSVVYTKNFSDKKDALVFEKQLKSFKNKKYLQKYLSL